jgi:hypothetical protein
MRGSYATSVVCTKCGGPTKVTDSRLHAKGLRRRRYCLDDQCGNRFFTIEMATLPALLATPDKIIALLKGLITEIESAAEELEP